MKLSGRAWIVVMAVGAGAVAVAGMGCSSSSNNSSGTGGSTATGGSGPGTGGATTAGSGGSTTAGTGGGTVAGTGGAGGGGGRATCGPFANGGGPAGTGGMASADMTFFVTSDTSTTGNLNGLAGADARCQTLAAAAGRGSKTWHAYLSVEHDANNGGNATNAKDRIGTGPWFNANGVMVAADVASLHQRHGDPLIFIDEHGGMINGQWTGSMTPNQHDILTGSNADGTVATGKTCSDWTSAAPSTDNGLTNIARVGHTDGFGGTCSTTPAPPNDVTSWNSAHDNAGCNDTMPRGGAGRLYCFAIN